MSDTPQIRRRVNATVSVKGVITPDVTVETTEPLSDDPAVNLEQRERIFEEHKAMLEYQQSLYKHTQPDYKADTMSGTSDCTCIVTFVGETAPLTVPVINRCPLHAAAADLLAACEAMLNDFIDKCRCDGTLLDCSIALAKTAIKAARGE